MKTPDEIKKGLFCGAGNPTPCKECAYRNIKECNAEADADAIEYIEQLEKRLADVNASPFDGGMSQAEYLNGEWIHGQTLKHEWMKCSVCLVSQTPNGCFSFCPNCGAKMYVEDGEQDADKAR